MKKILITGAQGFTGKHLVKSLNKKKFKIFSLKSNLLNTIDLNNEINSIKPNYVIHLAAISFVANKNISQLYRVNVQGTLNLLDGLKKNYKNIKKVILASSANVYENSTKKPINEQSKLSPQNHYAMSKIAMEMMSKEYMNHMPIIITRPFNYIGVGQNENFLIPKIAKHFAQKKKCSLGNINIKREFNSIDFIIRIYQKLLTSKIKNEIINLCSGKYYSITEIINIFEKISKKKIEINKNNKYVRLNDITLLHGNPKKLYKLLGKIEQDTIFDRLKKIYLFYKNQVN